MDHNEASNEPAGNRQAAAAMIPGAPDATLLWSRALIVAWLLLAIFLFDRATSVFYDYWLLQSLGYESVFWTNFRMGAILYLCGLVVFAAGISLPAFAYPLSARARRLALHIGLKVGLLAGFLLALRYHDFLVCLGQDYGKLDPVFGFDIGFFVFTLPPIWTAWFALLCAGVCALISSVACAFASGPAGKADPKLSRLGLFIGTIATPLSMTIMGVCQVLGAIGIWLMRYKLVYKDNSDSSIFIGAEYIDVVGFFSNLNCLAATAAASLGTMAAGMFVLRHFNRAANGEQTEGSRRAMLLAVRVIVALVLLDLCFEGLVRVRDVVAVRPNEPVIQIEYIQRHVDATRTAYGLDEVEEVSFTPRGPNAPAPSAESLLNSPTLKNAPLWPGFVSKLERLIDLQHSNRVVQTAGDIMVYGPLLEIFRQHQQLRTYYDFMSVDTVRYRIGDETKLLVSAVRELPLYEPKPWLSFWGQRFMLFTHGYGLVMAPIAEVTPEGEPSYASHSIPSQTAWPELAPASQRIYYGEGGATMAFSNVKKVPELDYPTEQGRATMTLDPKIGVPMNSLWKRIVFGWRSGRFFDMVCSRLIDDDTRIHYFRTPIERLERVASFLHFDTNPYAVVADQRIIWMVNAMTATKHYPYSMRQFLGDKSDRRSVMDRPHREVNYVEDSVKATIDAETGKVRFYKISNDPIIATWAQVYPELFVDGKDMPADVRAQLTYPLQLFHVQFDDIYILYHMKDAMYFFNMEDMWDDADEVLGAILDKGEAITFSMEPYQCLLETGPDSGGALPAAQRRSQFSLVMAFTPESSWNLRAIPVAYQDGDDYGRLVVLQVPKGEYVMSPEQADAAIDQDTQISQRIAWWNRQGNDVIRGHTSLLPVGNEIIFIEPIFIRSQQNPATQLKRVVVVFRGKVAMRDTLAAAVRTAVAKVGQAQQPQENGADLP